MRNRLQYFIFSFLVLSLCVSRAQQMRDSTAISFSLRNIEGKKYTLKENLGKRITVIVFWSTWGNDSMKMLHDLQWYYTQYHSIGLQVVSICVESQSIMPSDIIHIRAILNGENVTFQNLIDEKLLTFQAYSIVAVPTLIAVSPSMKIVFKLSGYSLIGKEKFSSFIDSTFGNKHSQARRNITEYMPNKDALRYSNMAMKKYERGDLESAEKYAIKAMQLDSLFSVPVVLSVEIALELNDTLKANELLSLFLRPEIKSGNKFLLQSFLYAKTGRKKEAMNLIEGNITDSLNAKERAMYAYVLGKAGLIQQALNEFQKAKKLSPAEFRIPMLRMEICKQAALTELVKKDSLLIKQYGRQ